jgi:hypothetical protein
MNGRESVNDIEQLDRATGQLDTLIERRATTKEKANAEEEGWKATVRQYNRELEEARRHQRITYYRTLSRNLSRMAEDFERRAEQLRAAL